MPYLTNSASHARSLSHHILLFRLALYAFLKLFLKLYGCHSCGCACAANNARYLHYVRKIWLILPELMCSFQRLSHACISINDFIVKPRTAHYNSYNLLDLDNPTWITVVILELIHALKPWPHGTGAFIRTKPSGSAVFCWLRITKLIAWSCTGDVSFKYLPYQLSMVVYLTTMVVTGNGG